MMLDAKPLERTGGTLEEHGCGCLVFVPDGDDDDERTCPAHNWGPFVGDDDEKEAAQ
jgi:hypothetical protein